MAEEFLDAAQVGAGFEQVGGEAVAQGMGVGMLGQAGGFGQGINDTRGLAAVEAAASATQEEGFFGWYGLEFLPAPGVGLEAHPGRVA